MRLSTWGAAALDGVAAPSICTRIKSSIMPTPMHGDKGFWHLFALHPDVMAVSVPSVGTDSHAHA